MALWLNVAGVEFVGTGKGGEITQGVIVPPQASPQRSGHIQAITFVEVKRGLGDLLEGENHGKNWVERRKKVNEFNNRWAEPLPER